MRWVGGDGVIAEYSSYFFNDVNFVPEVGSFGGLVNDEAVFVAVPDSADTDDAIFIKLFHDDGVRAGVPFCFYGGAVVQKDGEVVNAFGYGAG